MKLQEIQRCLKLDGMKDKEMLSKANKSNKRCKQKAFLQKKKKILLCWPLQSIKAKAKCVSGSREQFLSKVADP